MICPIARIFKYAKLNCRWGFQFWPSSQLKVCVSPRFISAHPGKYCLKAGWGAVTQRYRRWNPISHAARLEIGDIADEEDHLLSVTRIFMFIVMCFLQTRCFLTLDEIGVETGQDVDDSLNLDIRRVLHPCLTARHVGIFDKDDRGRYRADTWPSRTSIR